jgi:hypothetical protein
MTHIGSIPEKNQCYPEASWGVWLTDGGSCLVTQLQDPTNGVAVPPQIAATQTLGQHCWIRWPYLVEAIVEGVSNSEELVRFAFVSYQSPLLSAPIFA